MFLGLASGSELFRRRAARPASEPGLVAEARFSPGRLLGPLIALPPRLSLLPQRPRPRATDAPGGADPRRCPPGPSWSRKPAATPQCGEPGVHGGPDPVR